jgi:hypothetical protein
MIGLRDDGDVPMNGDGADVVAVAPCGSAMDFIATQRATGLAIDGGPRCIEDSAGKLPAGVEIAAGLDAPIDAAVRVRARAGLYPMAGATDDADLAKFIALGRGTPTWWAGLGHDAGILAWNAVRQLPPEKPEGDDEILKRKALVRRLLAEADEPLWTTDARGFKSGRVLKRTIAITSASAPTPKATTNTPKH